MEYYVLNDYRDKPLKKLNVKKLVKIISVLIIIITCIVLFALYVANSEFRGWIDKYILGKEITENTGAVIEVDSESTPYIYAYDRFVVVLNRNHLQNYNSSGNKVADVEISIINPLFASSGRYLCVAEKGGNKIYLISGEHILWQKDLEGEISQISVNRNGYVSVSHKTTVKMFSNEGKELTTAYLSSTNAIATAISNDNDELAIAEVNYSGSLLQSSIKIISVSMASSDPDNAVIYTYKADKKNIITEMKYQDSNVLVCMLDDKIIKRQGEETIEETKFDGDTIFADINLSGNSVEVKKNKLGLFNSEAQVQIKHVNNGKVNLYMSESLPKEISTYEDVIALNMGTEIDFIHTNGWLIKKYTSTRNIKSVVICGNLAGVVYKDKIELVNL